MEIRCRKGDCSYNTGCSCNAKNVKIGDGTAECETYEKDELKESVIVEKGNIFNAAKKLAAKNTKNVPLSCEAKDCLFNKKENCVANGICVVDDGATDAKCGASCATFIED